MDWPEFDRRYRTSGRTAARNHLGDPTDWSEYYGAVPDEVHRGIPFKPPTALWKQMDEGGDPQVIAHEIARRTSRKANTGLHWSGDIEQARGFAESGSKDFRGEVPIMLHGHKPSQEDIETRPAMLKRREVFPYTHSEKEVPVRKGRDVMVHAVSWKHPDKGWQRHELDQSVPHTASTAEEYAKQDAGKQDVWQVETEGKVQPLCDYHCQAALGRDRAANSLGAYYDLGQEPSGRLSGPEKGSCAHCGRNTDYLLQGLNRGVSRHDYRDSQQPRNRRTGPYLPTKTKPFTPVKQSESMMRKQAHDASENEDLRHCPFCGSGKIIGRADGTVECEFCHHYFTVQVQPQFPNFPQTMNGMPMSIPGMPGQVETPSGVGPNGEDMGEGMPPGMDQEDGGVPSDVDDGSDQTEDSADTQAEPPPFAKASFKTVTGARLEEDDYVRHLAIHLATDRDAMIARIRDEREQ